MEILLGLTIFFGLYMAWNIGANDVSNAMGTSVGSKAISFKQALIIAAIFEFAGAVLVGGHVSDTFRTKIVSFAHFNISSLVMIKGMVAALMGASAWIHLATFLGLPISTTHAIVGGVIGFGMLSGGLEAIQWTNVGKIAASWVISPLLGGLIAFFIFIWIRNKIIDSETPLRSFIRFIPYMIFIVCFILLLSLFYKGLAGLQIKVGFVELILILAGISFIITIIVSKIITRIVMTNIKNRSELEKNEQYGIQYSIIEHVFKYLQVITACFMAFAHGSNDVANATGPVLTIFSHLANTINVNQDIPVWILAIGAGGIVIGLFTYGYKVIRTMGEKITEISPTRGFSAEFGASLTILVGSKLGLPISTTHTIVGAIIGIGLARGIAAINKNIIKNIFLSWFITFPVTGLLTVLFYKILDALF